MNEGDEVGEETIGVLLGSNVGEEVMNISQIGKRIPINIEISDICILYELKFSSDCTSLLPRIFNVVIEKTNRKNHFEDLKYSQNL